MGVSSLKKILVVDDEPMTIHLIYKILEPYYNLKKSQSGEEALGIVKSFKPDLVIADILMPDMDGYQLTQKIQEMENGNIPILLITASDDPEVEIKGLSVGAKDFIHKPFLPAVFLKRIELILKEEEVKHTLMKEAETDPMTGLYNKRSAKELINHFIAHTEAKCALMILDLDHFKDANDTYGHLTGDKLLKMLAKIMKSCVRSNDIMARIGGDEFIIFFKKNKDVNSIVEKYKNISRQFSELMLNNMDEESASKFSISAGIALFPDDGVDYETLFENADSALYHVKQGGRGDYHFFSGEKSIEKKGVSEIIPSDINAIQDTLREHEYETGALFVTYDEFQNIYRFMKRRSERVNSELAEFALFSLTLNKPEGEYDEERMQSTFEEFMAVAAGTLRRGDVLCCYGQYQFIALLTGNGNLNGDVAARRILDNWRAAFDGDDISLEYEIKSL